MIDLEMHGGGAFPALRHLTSTLPSGGRYVIDVPAAWKGVLLVYSVGYIIGPPGQSPQNAPDEGIKAWLLAHGYALAGSQPVGLAGHVRGARQSGSNAHAAVVPILAYV